MCCMSDVAWSGGVPTIEMRHRLRIAMEHAGLKPADMAVTLDVHRNTIGHYLSGATHPTRAVLMAWGMRTGVSWRWILDGSEPEHGPGGLTQGYATSLTLVAA